jgi:hypothetical protein
MAKILKFTEKIVLKFQKNYSWAFMKHFQAHGEASALQREHPLLMYGICLLQVLKIASTVPYDTVPLPIIIILSKRSNTVSAPKSITYCLKYSIADPDPVLFDPWVQDPGWVKNQDPDQG